jgi:hypothetical protein
MEPGMSGSIEPLHSDPIITLARIKVTSGYKFQTAAYRTDFS